MNTQTKEQIWFISFLNVPVFLLSIHSSSLTPPKKQKIATMLKFILIPSLLKKNSPTKFVFVKITLLNIIYFLNLYKWKHPGCIFLQHSHSMSIVLHIHMFILKTEVHLFYLLWNILLYISILLVSHVFAKSHSDRKACIVLLSWEVECNPLTAPVLGAASEIGRRISRWHWGHKENSCKMSLDMLKVSSALQNDMLGNGIGGTNNLSTNIFLLPWTLFRIYLTRH